MKVPAVPKNEGARLQALSEYAILDTLPEKDYDDIALLAAGICGTPFSAITLVDTKRQWFKAHPGFPVEQAPRELSFCGHAIVTPDKPMIVNDSLADERFHDNPFVVGRPHIIFYAGVPLVNPQGFALGTLCIIDNEPRQLNEGQLESLQRLAHQVMNLFELRKKNLGLEESQREIESRNVEIERFSYTVSHDIKSPLNNIQSLAQMLKSEHGGKLDEEGKQIIDYLLTASNRLKNLVDGVIGYYRGDQVLAEAKSEVNLQAFLKEIVEMMDAKKEFEIAYPHAGIVVIANVPALKQIFLNLISNAIKYNDKLHGNITMKFSQQDDRFHFTVSDNGRGIAPDEIHKIFDLFNNLGKVDRHNNLGTGIGLSSVKRLVERLGGKIEVTSEPGIGTDFRFSIRK